MLWLFLLQVRSSVSSYEEGTEVDSSSILNTIGSDVDGFSSDLQNTNQQSRASVKDSSRTESHSLEGNASDNVNQTNNQISGPASQEENQSMHTNSYLTDGYVQIESNDNILLHISENNAQSNLQNVDPNLSFTNGNQNNSREGTEVGGYDNQISSLARANDLVLTGASDVIGFNFDTNREDIRMSKCEQSDVTSDEEGITTDSENSKNVEKGDNQNTSSGNTMSGFLESVSDSVVNSSTAIRAGVSVGLIALGAAVVFALHRNSWFNIIHVSWKWF